MLLHHTKNFVFKFQVLTCDNYFFLVARVVSIMPSKTKQTLNLLLFDKVLLFLFGDLERNAYFCISKFNK